MGLNPLWQEDVFLTVQDIQHQAQLTIANPYYIINCNGYFFIHLVPVQHQFNANELVDLQTKFQKDGLLLIHLWQDVWLSRRAQVISRIKSFLGLNNSFHGRKAKVVSLSVEETTKFLANNHLQGYIKAKYNYGLMADGQLIAAANFSAVRPMNSKGDGYLSAELVRFASVEGLTIVGGLSKLIKHFIKQVKINDLMTYADRDWSLGKGYDKLGFNLTSVTEPTSLYVDQDKLIRYFPHRLPKKILADFEQQNILKFEEFLATNGYIKLFNTGNLKYHLYL